MNNYLGFQKELSIESIKRAQAGDIEAFEIIYQTYADACYSLAFRICGQVTLAQDIVQEVFIKMMKSIGQYRNEGAFAGWLRQIVTRESINRIKKQNYWDCNDIEKIPLESTDLFNHNWLEACHDLDKLLLHLSDTARAVLWLHEVEGYTHKEIGKLFERSESFSKTTLSRAYITLKQHRLVQQKRAEQCI